LPIGNALDSSPPLEDFTMEAGRKINMEGRHVGLDFYDLLIEALIGSLRVLTAI